MSQDQTTRSAWLYALKAKIENASGPVSLTPDERKEIASAIGEQAYFMEAWESIDRAKP